MNLYLQSLSIVSLFVSEVYLLFLYLRVCGVCAIASYLPNLVPAKECPSYCYVCCVTVKSSITY